MSEISVWYCPEYLNSFLTLPSRDSWTPYSMCRRKACKSSRSRRLLVSKAVSEHSNHFSRLRQAGYVEGLHGTINFAKFTSLSTLRVSIFSKLRETGQRLFEQGVFDFLRLASSSCERTLVLRTHLDHGDMSEEDFSAFLLGLGKTVHGACSGTHSSICFSRFP